MKRWLFAAIVPASLLMIGGSWGCEDDPGTTDPGVQPPKSVLTKQERIDQATWDAAVAGNADLSAIASGLAFTSWGVVEDTDGNTVTWGEVAPGDAAVLVCDSAGSCTAARQTISGNTLTWADAAGGALTPITIGKPKLLKNLEGNDLTNKTTLALELSKDDLPAVNLEQREFHLLNTFGGVLDVSLGAVEAAAKRHGGFDAVTVSNYVREDTVLRLFRDLDGMDAVVWLSQSVRQEVVTGTQFKTVGMTVNRAGYGEATMDFQQIRTAADGNVMSGPGLVVLAASNSYSDGSAGQPGQGSLWQILDDGERTLVGVQGEADVNRIMAAAERFVDLYLSGEVGLAAALEQANTVFKGTTAQLRTNGADGLRTYPKAYADLWTKAGYSPSSARLTTYIAATPYCGGVAQSNSTASAWADVTFDGAYFSGTRAQKVDNEYSTDTHIRGVVMGLEPGDRILVEFWGDLDKSPFQDTYGFGEGIIIDNKTLDNGDIEITFDGEVHAAPYVNDAGAACVWNTPLLTTTTSEPSKLLITP